MKTATIHDTIYKNVKVRNKQYKIKQPLFKSIKTDSVLVDIVIPVFNEAHSLPAGVAKLNDYMQACLPYGFRITIVDNGSTDATWIVAQELSTKLAHVHAMHLKEKGRGRALKYAWKQSKADILAYMDVDLSTNLDSFLPMIEPLINGEAAVATGTRLQKNSRVTRSFKREFISRTYNQIIKRSMKTKFSDAQCGFKAIRRDAAAMILPTIKDNAWFFDTELLVKAEHKGWAINEVPVSWIEDKDSRVKISKTAADDLKGLSRVRQEMGKSPLWEKPAYIGLLVSAATLYLTAILHNNYANSYYAAAVQAASTSWKAWFFGSIDGASYITVDKPPVATWIMGLSARIFGFSSFSMLLPSALAGVITIALLYATVKRLFGSFSALLAGIAMLATPVAALMFGFNNPDSFLTMFLTASAYTFVRALDNKKPVLWLCATGLLTGFAFNTKMLQGVMILPVLSLVYLCCAKPELITRMSHLAIAGVVTTISTLWWAVAVWLTPASSRPYIGSTSNNNIWDLIMGYNGFGRLLGKGSGMGGGRPAGSGSTPSFADSASNGIQTFGGGMPPTGGGRMSGGGMGPGGTGFGGHTGILRIFNSDFGPNIAWFIPLALISAGLTIWLLRRTPRDNRQRAAILMWTGWVLIHIVIFSITSGVIHPYYPVVMTPAIAALVGVGAPYIWKAYSRRTIVAPILPISIALTSVVSFIILGYSNNWPALGWLILATGALASIVFIIPTGYITKQLKYIASASALFAILAAPIFYTVSTALGAHSGSIPTSGPSATALSQTNNETSSVDSDLTSYLLANQDGATWIVAVASANESAAIQISTKQPVMAIGGFSGSDNALTLDQFKALIEQGKVLYYAVGGQGMGGSMGGNNEIQSWVASNGAKVNYGLGNTTLYKLK